MRSARTPIPLLASFGGRADQVGILVPNLQVALSRMDARPGDSLAPNEGSDQPWGVWTYDGTTLKRRSFRGRTGTFAMRIALGHARPQIELIEPLAGPSAYEEWIATHGFGLHHLGFFVTDLTAVSRRMTEAGYPPLQVGYGTGADGSGGFAYFDTVSELGYCVEAIEPPGERRPSEPFPP